MFCGQINKKTVDRQFKSMNFERYCGRAALESTYEGTVKHLYNSALNNIPTGLYYSSQCQTYDTTWIYVYWLWIILWLISKFEVRHM